MSQIVSGFVGIGAGALIVIVSFWIIIFAAERRQKKAFDKFWKEKNEASPDPIRERGAESFAEHLGITPNYITPNLDKLVVGKDKITWQGIEYWYNEKEPNKIRLQMVDRTIADMSGLCEFCTVNISEIERLLEAQKREATIKKEVSANYAALKEMQLAVGFAQWKQSKKPLCTQCGKELGTAGDVVGSGITTHWACWDCEAEASKTKRGKK